MLTVISYYIANGKTTEIKKRPITLIFNYLFMGRLLHNKLEGDTNILTGNPCIKFNLFQFSSEIKLQVRVLTSKSNICINIYTYMFICIGSVPYPPSLKTLFASG